MKVERILIDLRPTEYARASGVSRELSIRVVADGTEMHLTEILPDDDFVARFEYLMDRAKHRIRQVVEGRQSKNEEK